ncbi:MAG: vWA domain-containing protein [Phycisphaeraceae bacterium]
MTDFASTSWMTSQALVTLGQTDVGFRSPSAAWLLPLALVAAAALTLWLYRGTTMARRWRWALAVVRGLVLAVVLTMLFQPVLVVEAADQVRQHVLVLLDVSSSMNMRDERQRAPDQAEARLALGEQANRHAATQTELAGLWRQLGQAEAALERRQWPALLEAYTAWRARLAALEAEPGDADALRQAVVQWAEQADRLGDQLERWTREVDPTEEQQAELAGTHATLREQVDAQLASLSADVRRDATSGGELSTMPSRLELARGLLDGEQARVLDALEDRHAVRYFSFGDELRPPPGDDGEASAPRSALLEAAAEEPSTQLGSALDEAVARHAGRPIAGVVLLTDGGSNRGLDPLAVASRLGERGIGVYPVGLGLPEPPDVVLEQMVAPPVTFVRDSVPLRVQVRSAGFEGRSVSVTATLDGDPVAEQTVTLDAGSQWVELPFSVDDPLEAADLQVSVSELPDEVSHANNDRSQNLRVIDEKIKVLYVEGKPRWEFRYLRAVLLRDHRLNVHLLMTEGDRELARVSSEHLAGLPADPEALFEYDLVILGDVPSRYFRGRQLELLAELVRERGGALAMLAGPEHAPSSYADTPLEAALPVRIGGRRPVMVSDSSRPVVTEAGRRSAMTRLVPDESRNERVWRLVGPMIRLPELEGLKPGATALATLDDARLVTDDELYPLLAWQRFGSGRSLFLATDQLWRLRFRRGDEYHARFWSQAIQFLTLARVMGEANRVQISTDAERYRAGQRVQVTAHVLGEGYEPLAAENYRLELEQREPQTDRRVLELEAVPGTAGLFEASFTAEAGTFRVSDPAEPDEALPATFSVEAVALELVEPAMDESLLRQVAQRSGGRYLTAADWPTAVELLEREPRPVTVRHERDLWSQPWLLALLVVLLSGEWFIRRRHQQL